MRPSTPLLLGVLLALTSSLHLALTSDPPCLAGCECSTVHTEVHGDIFHLACGHQSRLGRVPDLNSLTSAGQPVSIQLVLQDNLKLQRDAFPPDLNVAVLNIRARLSLDPDVFQNVKTSLEELGLYEVELDLTAPLTFLQGMSNLQRLLFSNVTSSSQDLMKPYRLTAPLFQGLGLDGLKEVKIHDSPISTIGPEVFRGLKTEWMSLMNDELIQFPGYALAKVDRLTGVSVYKNQIRRLWSGDTQGLCLTKLVLSENGLRDMEAGSLEPLKDCLTELDLSSNALRQVPQAALSPLKRLKKLDIVGNPIVNVTSMLQGDICPTHLTMGNFDDGSQIRHIADDAFVGGGRCVEFLVLYGTALADFPTESLRALTSAKSISIHSDALTTLRTGAMAGVHAWGLYLEAPVDTVESGAFENMTYHPMVLELRKARLTNLEFFFEYPAGTFIEIEVTSVVLECSCRLAEVKYNLEFYDLHSEAARTKSLGRYCMHDGGSVEYTSAVVREMFSKCGDFTTLPLRPDLSSCQGLQSSLLLVVLMMGVCLLLLRN